MGVEIGSNPVAARRGLHGAGGTWEGAARTVVRGAAQARARVGQTDAVASPGTGTAQAAGATTTDDSEGIAVAASATTPVRTDDMV